MSDTPIFGKTADAWKQGFPIIEDICVLRGTCWCNPQKETFSGASSQYPLDLVGVGDVSRRLERFTAFFMATFPEAAPMQDILKSPLQAIPNMQKALKQEEEITSSGTLMIELGSHLPISSSIEAKDGIYEALKTAEDIVFQAGVLKESNDYSALVSPPFQELFSRYAICVGPTGNLGLSIDTISTKSEFRVIVHILVDARQWKKGMLRSKGITVVEYVSDHNVVVEKGRKSAEHDPYCHFIDDENPETLFLGYSATVLRLKNQLEWQRIPVDQEHSLFVYLPCRIGGGPDGVALGLKFMFGDTIRCFFAEPTHSCCMMLGMATEENSRVNIQDFGIGNRTVVGGPAVRRVSGFVGGPIYPFTSGCYSLSDEQMHYMLTKLADTENLYLELGALASMCGPVQSAKTSAFRGYLEIEYLLPTVPQGTQFVWATGGGMAPKEEMGRYYRKGVLL